MTWLVLNANDTASGFDLTSLPHLRSTLRQTKIFYSCPRVAGNMQCEWSF
jgi:hypothetical protein